MFEFSGELNERQKRLLTLVLVRNKFPESLRFLERMTDEEILSYVDEICSHFLSALSHRKKELESFNRLKQEFIELKNSHERLKSGIAELIGATLPETSYAHLGELLTDPILQKMSLPVGDTGLSTRALNVCSELGIKTLGELIQFTPHHFMKQRNCGVATVAEISAMLEANELRWSRNSDI